MRLAKALEYHSGNLIAEMDLERMNHADIMAVFKSYYAEVLERDKARIDRDGPLDKKRVEDIRRYLAEQEVVIANDCADIVEYLGAGMEDGSKPLEEALNRIMERQLGFKV